MFFKRKVVVTHNGMFHADDVFAVAAISLLHKGCIRVIRSRDPRDWAKGDYVVDVGGAHEYEKNIFDHHQIGGAGSRTNGIPYAGFGLVWKYYGEKICGGKEVSDWVDRALVQTIDAGDNGVSLSTSTGLVTEYFLSDAVSAWRDLSKDGAKQEYVDFMKAVSWAKGVLSREIRKSQIVVAEIKKVRDVYSKTLDKRIIVLDQDLCWGPELKQYPEPLFVVYPDSTGNWRVKAIQENGFKARKSLPESWAGLRDPEIGKVTGVPDALFSHIKRFMAVSKSKEGAIALAKKALEA